METCHLFKKRRLNKFSVLVISIENKKGAMLINYSSCYRASCLYGALHTSVDLCQHPPGREPIARSLEQEERGMRLPQGAFEMTHSMYTIRQS